MAEPSVKRTKYQTAEDGQTTNEKCEEIEQQFIYDMLPPCEHGYLCDETDLLHFAEYFHPPPDVLHDAQAVVVSIATNEVKVLDNNNDVKETTSCSCDEAIMKFKNDDSKDGRKAVYKNSKVSSAKLSTNDSLLSSNNDEQYRSDIRSDICINDSETTTFCRAGCGVGEKTEKIRREKRLNSHSEEELDKRLNNNSEEEKDKRVNSQSEEEQDKRLNNYSEEEQDKHLNSHSEEGLDKRLNNNSEEEQDERVNSHSEEEQDEHLNSHSEEEQDQHLNSLNEEEQNKFHNSVSEEEYDCCFDTQEYISDNDETDNINECQKLSKNDTVLTRGPSIVKTYSSLTDEERKDLLRRAFELKSSLQNELKDTNEVLQKKMKELKRLQSKLETNYLYLDGEEEALSGTSMKLFPLFAERHFKEGSAEQIHFRIAESQFYRLLSSEMSPFKVTKVEYVINPALVHRFNSAKMRLQQYRSKEEALPLLGFHGTNIENIISICTQGFRVPGENGFRHASDPGWYGKGVYFSEYPSYTMPYIRGASRVLLCQVLPGKVFQCKHVVLGEPLRQGFDSHISPNGKELVIFNSHHILPSYIVHYKRVDGDYHYEIDE